MTDTHTGQYRTLDGIRGIAATIVMTRHLPGMFGEQTFPRCYLAVDLFFVLSGFVIANAYAERLRSGMGLGAFMRVRFIRFFPFYFLAFLFALASLALELALPGARDWTTLSLLAAVLFGAVLLPTPMGPNLSFFPLNLPCWSLGFELAVNLLYGLIHRWLSLKVLLGVIAVSGAVMLRYMIGYGNANFGDGWDALLAGASRVCFSFFGGVLIWRFRGPRKSSNAGALATGAVTAAILLAQVEAMPFDLIMVFAGFPLLVWLAARFEPVAGAASLFQKLGIASYGVYVIHTPVGQIVERLAALYSWTIPIPMVGLIFIPAITLAVIWLDKHYDQPLRRQLSARSAPWRTSTV